MDSKEPVCLVKCIDCKETFRSMIQFGDAQSFFTSTLVGNTVQCPKCGAMTLCNKENMYFNDGQGNVEHGKDTIPG